MSARKGGKRKVTFSSRPPSIHSYNEDSGRSSSTSEDFLTRPYSPNPSDEEASNASAETGDEQSEDSTSGETSIIPRRKQTTPKRRKDNALKEIMKLQNSTNFLIPRLPFQRLNRAWEKDRRDRLNNTFDKLAKLLPEYQPKVNFSKIEILHKTIVYIEDLRKKLRDVLSTQNASILKTQEELEESVRALLTQNNNLVELLEKANVKVPHFVGPKLLSFIVNVHDATESKDNENEKCDSKTVNASTKKIFKTSQSKSEGKSCETKERIEKLPLNNQTSYDKLTANSPEKQKGKTQPKAQLQQQQQQLKQKTHLQQQKPQCNSQLSNIPEVKEVQSFGSVDLIPVSNESISEPKIHEIPVKNFVEITPLISDQNDRISTTQEKFENASTQPKVSTCDEESKSQKSENTANVSTVLTNIQPSNDCKKIVRSELENGIVCIDTCTIDKSKKDEVISNIEKVANSQCEKRSPNKKRDSNGHEANQSTISANIPFDASEKGLKTTKIVSTQEDQSNVTKISIKEISNTGSKYPNDHNNINNNITSNETYSGKRAESIVLSKDELNESISNEKDLPDELFGNFRLDQTPNESNPNTLSPTAAFLLSFPVVSTVSSSKPTETDNSYSVGGDLLRLDEKPNQPKDHCLFESISSILNDLNDVSDGKSLSNADESHATSFAYGSNKNRTNVQHNQNKPTHSLNDGACNGPMQKISQKNLNINNLLSNDKVKCSRSSSTKQQSTNATKKIDIAVTAAATVTAAECLTNSQLITNPTTNERTNFVPSSKPYENCATVHNENASDFYVSLSTLGLPLKSVVPLPTPSINPSVGSHFNFQISSLAQPRNLIESRPLVADTPFTFSLTKNSDTTTTSNMTTKTTVAQSSDEQYQMTGHRTNRTQKKTAHTAKHLVNDRFVMPADPPLTNRCNSFNPFSFDNPTMLTSSSSIGIPNLATVSSNNSIGTPFTFTLTPSFSTISTSTPLLTNHDPLFSSSFDMPHMRSTNALTKTPKKEKSLVPPFSGEKEQSSGWKNTAKNLGPVQPMKSSKNLVNWMTSSVNKPSQDLQDFIPQVTSHCVGIEEPSPWSPNRIAMDNPGLISSSALPMLQGDLALNTMSNSIVNANPPPMVNRLYDTDVKKSLTRPSNSQPKFNTKSSNSRKPEQSVQQTEHRSVKCNKTEKIHNQSFKSHHASTSVSASSSSRMGSESGPITSNFHSVSQLLDQERQTVNKNNCYMPNDGKMILKDSNSMMSMTKSKYYPKYDIDSSNHHQIAENKYTMNACNIVSSGGACIGTSGSSNSTNNNIISSSNSEITSNECDRDLFGGYFFGQSKRLKLNYHPSDILGSQNSYENSTTNDMLTSYVNYQSYDNDCNNVSANSCINNLTNQSYSYQYPQPQSYAHQTQQQPLNTCDPLETSTYFQAPVSTLCSYKPPTFNDVNRSDSKLTSTHQSSSFLHQSSKSSSIVTAAVTASAAMPTDHISNAKLCSTSSSSTSTNYSTQMPMGSVNRNSATCPTKTIHYPSHSNINHNLPLNQAWNDGFTWMPYTTNTIDKPYNNNLVFNATSDTTSNKTSINISGNNNNTIPNFNLTTIFPDYNKS